MVCTTSVDARDLADVMKRFVVHDVTYDPAFDAVYLWHRTVERNFLGLWNLNTLSFS